MKFIALPAAAGTAVIVALGLGLGASIVSADQFPFAKPAFRFEPFHELESTSQNVAKEKLGYLEITWNVHGLASVESRRWASLTSNEREGAGVLGFSENTWDCFINHYEQNTWDELAEKGVQDSFVGLGWSRAHWEQTTDDVPHTEARWWEQLTDNEKVAANGLCYFKDNWNRIDMNPNPTFFPHPPPLFRYRPWGELDAVTRNVASGMLNYTEGLWDDLGSSIMEKNTFLNLKSRPRDGALELGFYTHTWDCFMNHYLTYYWSSFHGDLKVAVEALGWDEIMWRGGGAVPPSENKMWADLTPEEKAAATRLCYFKEIWDEEPIERWYDYDSGMNTGVSADGPVPDDINLDIFLETGYAGKQLDEMGVRPVRVQGLNGSFRTSIASTMVLGILMVAFLFD